MEEKVSYTENRKPKEKEPKKLRFIGCKECGLTNVTLIKATDSYYCKFCFDKLGKEKFSKTAIKKKGRK